MRRGDAAKDGKSSTSSFFASIRTRRLVSSIHGEGKTQVRDVQTLLGGGILRIERRQVRWRLPRLSRRSVEVPLILRGAMFRRWRRDKSAESGDFGASRHFGQENARPLLLRRRRPTRLDVLGMVALELKKKVNER